ncbi:metal-dependent hydrolase [Halopelagius longus]|uniref:LexA-binding, inner membrane-associated putative hydrolase n=1 Tax=Halopelagius longus TaxID=1236180 RepID=A0A1H0YQ48_9EURY|nr:metal-dependent hydrolase [Halopelagius longus]RDI72620.1 metal-dependent hydrolase [Halopelagius longus]SDQ17357.1 LexA-binding, inner membrane-associated putative hydrolase [Halopelagius longus]
MPSTLVHVAVGGLLGAGLHGAGFDRRAAAVVFVAAAFPDVDTFFGFVLPGAHRALFHTFLLPAALVAAVAYDTRVRSVSRLRTRFGPRGVRLAWVGIVTLVGGGILPDLFTNGVNAFYPLHDAFYTVNGQFYLSNRQGVVQTFVDLSPSEPASRTTGNFHYSTGADPSPGADPENVERIFPIAMSGTRLMLLVLSAFVVGARLRENERSAEEEAVAGTADAETDATPAASQDSAR